MLSLKQKIDLVIPRGSSSLVQNILEQAKGQIPVLGHTEGVCHVYVDAKADMQKAVAVGNDGRGWRGFIGITIVSCLLLPLSNDIPVTQSTLLNNAHLLGLSI